MMRREDVGIQLITYKPYRSANIAARSSKKQSLGRTFAFSDNMAGPRLSNSSEFDRSSISTSYSGTSYSGATTYSGTEFIDMAYQQNEFSFTSMESERSSNIVRHFLCPITI